MKVLTGLWKLPWNLENLCPIWKYRTKKWKSETFNSQSYLQSLKDQISFLENEKCELEEMTEEFTTQKLSFLKKNKYSDIIRMVHEDILCMGLSTKNVEKVNKFVYTWETSRHWVWLFTKVILQ